MNWSLICSFLFLEYSFPSKFSWGKVRLHQGVGTLWASTQALWYNSGTRCFCALRSVKPRENPKGADCHRIGLVWTILDATVEKWGKFLGLFQCILNAVETFPLIFTGFQSGPGKTKTQPQISLITNAMQVFRSRCVSASDTWESGFQ